MRGRLRLFVAVAAVASSAVLPGPAPAVDVPGSCVPKPHLPPGCLPALGAGVKDEVARVIGPGLTLPNLVPDVTFAEVGYWYDLAPDGTVVQSPRNIRFSVAIRNDGAYAIDLLGEAGTDLTSTSVQQCVSWTVNVCRARERVGGFMWHPEHNHFHFQEFATYELRRLDADGRVDRSDEGLLQIAPKVSFCLMDYEASSSEAPPPFYVQCLGVNQGISPGWADVYPNFLPGQGLVSEGLPDGLYAIVVRVDPFGRLYETSDADNETAVVVELYDGGNQARVVGPAS